MTAPDRIWCHPTERQPVPAKDRRNAKWVRGRWKDHDSKASGDVEYIRADLAKAQAEALLSDPRVQALVEAGNKMADGIEYGMLGLSDAVKQWDAASRAIGGE